MTKTQKSKKPLPPTYLFISMAVMAVLFYLAPIRTIIPFPINLAGLAPLLFGIWINLSADKLFKISSTTVKPHESSTCLITTGVFRMTRNPMYLGFVCILVGIAILAGCLSPFIVPILFAFLMDRLFIRVEEKMLEQQFGKEWNNYKNQTRKWM